MIRRGGAARLPIKLAVVCGTVVALCLGALLAFLALGPDRNRAAPPGRDVFHRLMRDYDRAGDSEPGPEQLSTLSSLLDKMEQNAQGVESWLSLLKRRRALAPASPRMLSLYQASSRRAAAAFPWSEPLAAVAAAALLQGAPITEDTAAALRRYTGGISETRLCPLALGIVILTGGFDSLNLAAEARGEALLNASLPLIRPGMPKAQGDRLIVNLALLRLVKGDRRGAGAQLQGLSRPEIPELRVFLGDYYYDFGDPLRAATMFNRAGGEEGLLRSADALWLGGAVENARNIWLALGKTEPAGPAVMKSLYNLAVSAPAAEERERWFAQAYEAGRKDSALRRDPPYCYNLIAHTRTLPPYEALAILDDGEAEGPGTRALRDLEALRRQGELWPPDRTVAETWLLLGRYPEDSRLYQWAAWYFERQRLYDEIALLVKNAGYRGIEGPWLDLGAGLQDMTAGRPDQAEERLRAVAADPGARALWQAEANLGLLMEARRAPAEALRHYETAAARIAAAGKIADRNPAAGRAPDRRAAGRLQLRIAGCLRALGRAEESRRALLYSLDLYPDNLEARLELRRLDQAPAGDPLD
jgi:tetratricopeptide (TPR) repeat protein